MPRPPPLRLLLPPPPQGVTKVNRKAQPVSATATSHGQEDLSEKFSFKRSELPARFQGVKEGRCRKTQQNLLGANREIWQEKAAEKWDGNWKRQKGQGKLFHSGNTCFYLKML